jgi:outer membrane immunogenic protein
MAAELDYPRAPTLANPVLTTANPANPLLIWSGAYVGLNAGWALGGAGETSTPNAAFIAPGQFPITAPFLAGIETTTLNPRGFIGGGQVGWNYQLNHLVVGVEGDIEYFGLSGGGVSFGPLASPAGDGLGGTFQATTDFLATGRGRLGWAFDQTMVYGTGGVAVSGLNFIEGVTITKAGTAGFLSTATRTTLVGWTAGGGIEQMIGRGWIVRLEYLHIDLGSQDTVATLIGPLSSGKTGCNGCTMSTQTHLWSDIVRAGISWKFGGYTSGS